jgi:quercetin dioxygenase-like cupin family protein
VSPSLDPFTRRSGGEHTRSYLGLPFTFLADAADTGGALSVMEVTARPGAEPPPHTHTAEDETFYILDGAWTFRCGTTTTDAGPGTLMFLPRGLIHGFTAHTDACRALVIMSPGGLEATFHELSDATTAGGPPPRPRPIPHVLAAFAARGVQFSPPPNDAARLA